MTSPSTWEYRPPAGVGVREGPGDRYLVVLGVVLVGYALMGRGFAYLGAPPLFIGEVVLAAGLALLLFARRLPPLVLGPAMWMLLPLMAWVGVRTAMGVGTYGVDAIRDAMIVGYALFAFIVAGLLMQRPERLRELLVRYRILAVVILSTAWAVYLAFRLSPESIPALPWTDKARMIENKPGDLLVHLAGITAFLILGFKRATPLWLVLLVIGTATMMAGNRGGMLGYMLAMVVFAVMKPRSARFGRLAYVGIFLLLLGLAAPSSVKINEGSRTISVDQVWENVQSVFGKSDSEALNTTTEWRLLWWKKIVGYTFGGPYLLDGKGFGINLATDDGFRVDKENSLRSPHNAHLTLLARGGVPAFVLWLLVQALWVREVLLAWARARRAGQTEWVGVLAMCMVYWVAAQINGTFDVYLEGPMGGIWFWVVFGVAMAATRLQQTHPHLLDGLRVGTTSDPRPPSAPRWSVATGARPPLPGAGPRTPTWSPLHAPPASS